MHGTRAPPRTTAAAVRPFIAFALLALALYSLLAHWEQRGDAGPTFADPDYPEKQSPFEINVLKPGSKQSSGDSGLELATEVGQDGYNSAEFPRKVVAHFILEYAHTFTEKDWDQTFTMAEDTGLDGLVLRIGDVHNYEMEQARTAYKLAEKRINDKMSERPLYLLLALDMNRLPSVTARDAHTISYRIATLIESPAQMLRDGRPILSTLNGARAFGTHGWKLFLKYINGRSRTKVFFWPAFFESPDRFVHTDEVDGAMAWNSAWPSSDSTISIDADMPYLKSGKPFMAAISPCFYTHYGDQKPWNLMKNFIYRSDDLLMASRFAELIGLPTNQSPEMIQLISWNGYDESHYIGPVMGNEPGSTAWTTHMDHGVFLKQAKYFTSRWRDNAPEVEGKEITLWMWYRTHPAAYHIKGDKIGRPGNAGWARDLINIMVLVPHGMEQPKLEIRNGFGDHIHKTYNLYAGHANGLKVGFVPGDVQVSIKSAKGTHIKAKGRSITSYKGTLFYNYNFWSKEWVGSEDYVIDHRGSSSEKPHKPDSNPAFHPIESVAQDDSKHPSGASSHPDPAHDNSPAHLPPHGGSHGNDYNPGSHGSGSRPQSGTGDADFRPAVPQAEAGEATFEE